MKTFKEFLKENAKADTIDPESGGHPGSLKHFMYHLGMANKYQKHYVKHGTPHPDDPTGEKEEHHMNDHLHKYYEGSTQYYDKHYPVTEVAGTDSDDPNDHQNAYHTYVQPRGAIASKHFGKDS